MRQAERLGWSSGLRRLGMARSPRALKPAKQLRYAQATTDAAAGGARFATSYARAKANGCAPPAVRVRPDSVRCCGAASREAAPCPVTAAGNSVRSRPCACPASWPMCAFQGQMQAAAAAQRWSHAATQPFIKSQALHCLQIATALCSSPQAACTPFTTAACPTRRLCWGGRCGLARASAGAALLWPLTTCTLAGMCGSHAPMVQGSQS